MHPGALLLHRDGVLPVRPPLRPAEERGGDTPHPARQLGQADRHRHELLAQPQDHTPRPQEPQVSALSVVGTVLMQRIAKGAERRFDFVIHKKSSWVYLY